MFELSWLVSVRSSPTCLALTRALGGDDGREQKGRPQPFAKRALWQRGHQLGSFAFARRAEGVDRGQPVPGRDLDDHIAMKRRQRAPRHDQTAIRGSPESRHGVIEQFVEDRFEFILLEQSFAGLALDENETGVARRARLRVPEQVRDWLDLRRRPRCWAAAGRS